MLLFYFMLGLLFSFSVFSFICFLLYLYSMGIGNNSFISELLIESAYDVTDYRGECAYADSIYAKVTIDPVHWSTSRITNLIKEPYLEV